MTSKEAFKSEGSNHLALHFKSATSILILSLNFNPILFSFCFVKSQVCVVWLFQVSVLSTLL